MTEHTWKIEKNLCRCCHSEGAFTNLAEPCLNLGEEEIFSQMLLESFDVNVAPVTGPLCEVTYTICDGCIQRLRDACYFKRQVVKCEKRFHDLYSKNVIKFDSCYEVKVEAPDSDDEDDMKLEMFEDEDDFAVKSDDDEKKLEVQIEVEELTPKPKRKVAPKRKAKNTKVISKLRKKLEAPGKAKDKTEADADESPEADGAKQRKEKKGRNISKARTKKIQLSAEQLGYKREGDSFVCTHCDKRYSIKCKYHLELHIQTVHHKIPRYPCPHCEESFMTFAPFVKHKMEAHNIDDRFKCNACDGVFPTKTILTAHKKSFHMMGESQKCNLCDFETHDVRKMYRHKFNHKTIKDERCRFCSKAFKRHATLMLHERIHKGDKRYTCSECEQMFVQKASLNYHMLKYHPSVHF